jgi:hypothetical protein
LAHLLALPSVQQLVLHSVCPSVMLLAHLLALRSAHPSVLMSARL